MNAPAASAHVLPATGIPPFANLGYASEVRFGTVLYGGVSLAIYINGVVREMYEMVRATPREGPSNDPLQSTSEIYRRLSWLIDNPPLREMYYDRINRRSRTDTMQAPADVWDEQLLAGLQPTRLVVDVVSGTSAGGINGIFLATALTNRDANFDLLRKLWIEEGDISLLLNDARSYQKLGIAPDLAKKKSKAVPNSLLNSDRMYLKLLAALKAMNSDSSENEAELGRSLVDDLDLFITTTDIAGAPITLRLCRQVVQEKRHKQNFHFRFSKSLRHNDFTSQHNALLAFAARCTSSFPFAFEPMTMEAVKGLLQPKEYEEIENRWHEFLSCLPKAEVEAGTHVQRAFGDGGYLDNKPFTYVAKTLATRQALIPVERKLVYIEPVPERISASSLHSEKKQPPDALENSIAALFGIPRYETIREDLQEVLSRNRNIEKVEHIIREGEKDLHRTLTGTANPFIRILKKTGHIPPWPNFNRKDMAELYGTAYLAYRRIRVSSVADELAYTTARLWKIDFTSDQFYALTALLRAWQDSKFPEESIDKEKTTNTFLASFDLDFRIRRLNFLLKQVDHSIRLFRRRLNVPFIGNTTQESAFEAGQDRRILSDEDRRVVELFQKEKIDLISYETDFRMLHQTINVLTTLKSKLNEVHEKLRDEERKRRSKDPAIIPIAETTRKELEDILSLILGETLRKTLKLPTLSGESASIELPESTTKACACARTLQDIVSRRAKEVFRQIALPRKSKDDVTMLYHALSSSIESLRLAIRPPLPRDEFPPEDQMGTYDVLGKPELRLISQEHNDDIEVDIINVKAIVLNTFEGKAVRRLLGRQYIYFDLFDQMSFPLYHDTGIGEPATVDVIRISPKDATNLVDEEKSGRRKLAGTALANFGAFLDRKWRCNDAMWGRLDGAERLIHTLLPMEDPSTKKIREELTDMAHRTILRETILPEEAGELTELLCKALEDRFGMEVSAGRIHDLLRRADPDNTDRYRQLANVLASFLNEQRLMEYVRNKRDVDRSLNPKETFDSAARAVNITGRMLAEFNHRYGKESFIFRWIARVGQLLHGLISISVPGTLKEYWGSHAIWMIYLSEFAFLLFAYAFSVDSPVKSFIWNVIGITLVLHVLKLVISDIVMSDDRRTRKLRRLGTVAVLVLACWGGLDLYDRYILHNNPFVADFLAKLHFAPSQRPDATQQISTR